MPICAKGTVDHRMDVAITDFDDQDVGKAIMIGDKIELQGRVTFTEDATDAKTAEYFVENSFFWGGFIGAVMMSEAARRLSKDLARRLSRRCQGTPKGPPKHGQITAVGISPEAG